MVCYALHVKRVARDENSSSGTETSGLLSRDVVISSFVMLEAVVSAKDLLQVVLRNQGLESLRISLL